MRIDPETEREDHRFVLRFWREPLTAQNGWRGSVYEVSSALGIASGSCAISGTLSPCAWAPVRTRRFPGKRATTNRRRLRRARLCNQRSAGRSNSGCWDKSRSRLTASRFGWRRRANRYSFWPTSSCIGRRRSRAITSRFSSGPTRKRASPVGGCARRSAISCASYRSRAAISSARTAKRCGGTARSSCGSTSMHSPRQRRIRSGSRRPLRCTAAICFPNFTTSGSTASGSASVTST